MIYPAIEGFALGGGLIIAIGAQNAFILRQGLLRQHVFVLCFVAALSDALLILLGVGGVGTLVQSNPKFLTGIALLGAAFLFAYGLFAFRRAMQPQMMEVDKATPPNLRPALATSLPGSPCGSRISSSPSPEPSCSRARIATRAFS